MNLQSGFLVGDWEVRPLEGRLVSGKVERRIQPKSMDVLLQLAKQSGSVVTRDELLASVWGGRAQSDEPLTRCIGELRRAFGDASEHPNYIETIHKRGYKLIPSVIGVQQPEVHAEQGQKIAAGVGQIVAQDVSRKRIGLFLLVTFVVAALILGRDTLLGRSPGPEQENEIAGEAAIEHTIAVLPFENLSDDPANDAFTDGIHDDILTQISRISALRVISRLSSVAYRGTDKDTKSIGRELNADNLIEGSVQRVGDRIRINVLLISAETNTHLWSQTFDRELTAVNVFAIQSEIATTVANELRARITPAEERLIKSLPTENLAALEAYFQARYLIDRRTTESNLEAERLFERALAIDSNLSLAWVGLAQIYLLQIYNSGETNELLLEKAETAIRRALELEDKLSDAHAALGRLSHYRGDNVAAEMAFKRAIELNPNSVDSNHYYALFLDFMDRPQEAVAFIRRSLELDPRSPLELLAYGAIMERLGNFDEALQHFRNAIELDPQFAPGHRLVGHLNWRTQGRLNVAVEHYTKAIELDPGRVVVPENLSAVYLDLGDLEMAQSWGELVRNMAPQSFYAARSRMLLDGFSGKSLDDFQYPGAVFTRAVNSWPVLSLLVAEDLDEGQIERARSRLETAYPSVMAVDDFVIDRINVQGVIDLAYFLLRTGERQLANNLLDRCLSFVRKTPRLGWTGTMVADARIYALKGNSREAINAARSAFEEGWRYLWWYYVKLDPIFASVRNEPAFQELVDDIEADMAAQLERLKQSGFYRRPGATAKH